MPGLATDVAQMPDLSLLGQFSLGGFAEVGVLAALLLVFTLMITDCFDMMGSVVGLGAEAELLDEQGRLPDVGRVLLVAAVAAVAAVAGGAASATRRPT